jgi:hypothetical protein
MVKRFLLFAGETFYPQGGCDDYIFSVDKLSDAIKWIEENVRNGREYKYDWANVLDTQEEKICYEYERHL